MKPLVTMDLDDGMLWTFDWGSGRMLATGSTAGRSLSIFLLSRFEGVPCLLCFLLVFVLSRSHRRLGRPRSCREGRPTSFVPLPFSPFFILRASIKLTSFSLPTLSSLALPIHHISDHTGPVRSLSYLRHPQADAHGNVHLDWEQSLIVSVSSNGKILLTDLRDAAGSAGGGGSSCVLTISRGGFEFRLRRQFW